MTAGQTTTPVTPESVQAMPSLVLRRRGGADDG
jgi:hypothetical protein